MNTNYVFILWAILTQEVVVVMHFEDVITYAQAVEFANLYADLYVENHNVGVAHVVVSPNPGDPYYWDNEHFSDETKSIIRKAIPR